jgi:hypothetical protein
MEALLKLPMFGEEPQRAGWCHPQGRPLFFTLLASARGPTHPRVAAGWEQRLAVIKRLAESAQARKADE